MPITQQFPATTGGTNPKLKTTSRLIMEAAKTEDSFVTKYGCLMLELDYDNSQLKTIFDEKDLNEDEGGVVEFKHVTILYGFHDTVDPEKVLQVSKNYSNFKNLSIAMDRISLFENDKFDVVKFDVKESEFYKLNKILSGKFPFTNKYPIYHGHCTIAYVNPGMGDKYLTKLKNFKTMAKATKFIYKDAGGKKTELEIDAII